jgi:hypothetical protein
MVSEFSVIIQIAVLYVHILCEAGDAERLFTYVLILHARCSC